MKTITLHINKLTLDWNIGIFDFEYQKSQPVEISIELKVEALESYENATYDDIVCYKTIVDNIKALRDSGHIELVETLTDKVADICLQDSRVIKATIRAFKTDIIAETQGVGISITKKKKKD